MKRRIKLGQHFLVDQDVLAKIISCIAVKKGDKIIEVGPGKGILTAELLAKGARVTAVEIDEKLVEILRRRFKNSENLEIINADILNYFSCHSEPVGEESRERSFADPSLPSGLAAARLRMTGDYKIVGNIPYQITSPLLRKIFKLDNPPELIVFMVQKEVAERIVASPGDSRRGFLSVIVQYYGRPEIIEIVPKESFYPVPKVESAILRLKPRYNVILSEAKNLSRDPSVALLPQDDSYKEHFFQIVQAGFSQKRKKLRNSLAGGLHLEPKIADQILQKAGIDSNLRAEDLSIKQWKKVNSML